jgi:transcriptional regulator with XRE-family HTH domain
MADARPGLLIGEQIREIRVRRGLSLEQVGAAIGVHPKLLSAYEKSKHSIKLERAIVLANYYGVCLLALIPGAYLHVPCQCQGKNGHSAKDPDPIVD